MIQSTLNIYNTVSHGASITGQAILAGAKRPIDWMNLDVSQEGFLLSMGLNVVALISAELISTSSIGENAYFKPTLIIATLALSALITPKISAYFNWSISYGSALKIAAFNLSVRVSIFALSWLYEKCFLYTNKETFLEAVKSDSNAIKSASHQLLDDKEVMREVIIDRNNAKLLEYASSKLRKDKDFVLEVVKIDGSVVQFASVELLDNKDFVLEAVRRYKYTLLNTSERLKKDEDVVLEAVKYNGNALVYASEELQNNGKIVLAAVKQCGSALTDASEDLKKDEEIVKAAIKSDPPAFQFASEELRNSESFFLEAIKIGDENILKYASDNLKDNEVAVKAAIKKYPKAIQYASPRLQKELQSKRLSWFS